MPRKLVVGRLAKRQGVRRHATYAITTNGERRGLKTGTSDNALAEMYRGRGGRDRFDPSRCGRAPTREGRGVLVQLCAVPGGDVFFQQLQAGHTENNSRSLEQGGTTAPRDWLAAAVSGFPTTPTPEKADTVSPLGYDMLFVGGPRRSSRGLVVKGGKGLIRDPGSPRHGSSHRILTRWSSGRKGGARRSRLELGCGRQGLRATDKTYGPAFDDGISSCGGVAVRRGGCVAGGVWCVAGAGLNERVAGVGPARPLGPSSGCEAPAGAAHDPFHSRRGTGRQRRLTAPLVRRARGSDRVLVMRAERPWRSFVREHYPLGRVASAVARPSGPYRSCSNRSFFRPSLRSRILGVRTGHFRWQRCWEPRS